MTNNVVVRTEGRRFAGIVVQGDRLGEWVRLARSSDADDAADLVAQLKDALSELTRASREAGIDMPR